VVKRVSAFAIRGTLRKIAHPAITNSLFMYKEIIEALSKHGFTGIFSGALERAAA